MGILYDFINKGITDEEVSICCKEMRLLVNRINEVLDSEDIFGISIFMDNLSTYKVRIKMQDSSEISIVYNKENGTVSPCEGFENLLQATLFCKSIKGQLYNTINLLGRIKHRQTSITYKLGNESYAYVYGSSLIIVVKSLNEQDKISKLIVKDTNKIEEYIKLGL